MTSITCPNCGKSIGLVEPKDLKEDYGLGPNSKARLNKDGTFPIPILKFPNRNIWLRSDIDAYMEEQNRERISKSVQEIEDAIAHLPKDEQQQIRKMLANR